MLICAIFIPFALGGCGGKAEPLNPDYGGIGFEWDIFDISENWTDDNFDYIKAASDYFSPAAVRTMLDVDKFVTGFDENTRPIYNFQTPSIENLCDIIDYCEEKGITVAIGLWHARHEGNFIHAVLNDEGNPLFAEMSLKLAEYLINEKGYTCVKYVVPYNEPNYTKRTRAGKALESYTLWSECMNNFIEKIPQTGFDSPLTVAAPDTSSLGDSEVWVEKAVRDFDPNIGLYQIHLYPSSYLVKGGGVTSRLKKIVDLTPKTGKQFWIYESGIHDGKVEGVGQTRINTYDFALEMADLTLQTILAGCDGMVYWSIDAKLHQKDGTDIDFGLLNSATGERRPWFYFTALMSRCLQKGSAVYFGADEKSYRAVYVKKGADVFAIAVNRGDSLDAEFKLPEGKANALYKYVLSEEDIFISDEGKVLYNEKVNGNFRDGIKTAVPSDSMVILSTKQL